jgi:trans-2-enoyl-CoA reductase
MASQIAASELFGASVVSLVRRGSKTPKEYDEMVQHLKEVGKTVLVVAEEDLKQDKEAMKQFQSQLRDFSGTGELPKLALNAVGGESAKQLFRAMAEGGTLVTYGGMSGEPVVAATPQLIFKDVRVRGYWHSRWMTQQSQASKQEMMDILAKAVVDGDVKCPPACVFPLHDVQGALHWQTSQGQGAIREKLVWDCRE